MHKWSMEQIWGEKVKGQGYEVKLCLHLCVYNCPRMKEYSKLKFYTRDIHSN